MCDFGGENKGSAEGRKFLSTKRSVRYFCTSARYTQRSDTLVVQTKLKKLHFSAQIIFKNNLKMVTFSD